MRSSTRPGRVWLAVAVGAAFLLCAAAPPATSDRGFDIGQLNAAVSAELRTSYALPAPAGRRVVVELKRRSPDGRWAFGGAVLLRLTVRGSDPVALLFLAHREAHGWRVGTQGSAPFAAMAVGAPDSVVHGDERRPFAATVRDADPARASRAYRSAGTGLALPWGLGQAWGGGQIHGDTGDSRPFNAIDFYGGDGNVRASASGLVYRFCTGSAWPMLEVVHGNGWTTGYYHLNAETSAPDGSTVYAGQYLGHVAMELPCGGETTGPHVHWTLWRAGTPVAVNGLTIGGWTFYEGPAAYGGYAMHGGTRVDSWNCCHLTNFGIT